MHFFPWHFPEATFTAGILIGFAAQMVGSSLGMA